MEKIALIIPTLNGGRTFYDLMISLKDQTIEPQSKLIIDSMSTDETPRIANSFGFNVISIKPEEFNHGATRQMGVELNPNADIIIFLTQDAILFDSFALENLIASFKEDGIGGAYGRQIPHKNASLIGEHARSFNYSSLSKVKSITDIEQIGIKTAFISNTFGAYRRKALIECGGFPSSTIFGEDTYIAAKMILSGWKIAYCAEAKVYHSHDYTFFQEFKRYFDIGVFHARESWIRENFGGAEGEGLRFIKSEMKYLLKSNFLLIPSAIYRSFLKFIAFRLGIIEKKLPRWLKVYLSMNLRFWDK